MDLKFLVSVIALLAGIWVYLHKRILAITVASPAERTLLFLGYMQFTVLTYIVLALAELYYLGTAPATANPTSGLPVITTIFLQTWPLAVAFLVVSFLTVKASDSESSTTAFIWVLGLVCVGAVVYQLFRGQSPKLLLIFFSFVGIFGIPYVLLMSFFLADVEITTDKQFYIDTDTVNVSVRAGGYLFRPEITSVTFGVYKKEGHIHDGAFLVRPAEHVGSDLIQVDYVPQAIHVKRRSFHTVRMARAR